MFVFVSVSACLCVSVRALRCTCVASEYFAGCLRLSRSRRVFRQHFHSCFRVLHSQFAVPRQRTSLLCTVGEEEEEEKYNPPSAAQHADSATCVCAPAATGDAGASTSRATLASAASILALGSLPALIRASATNDLHASNLSRLRHAGRQHSNPKEARTHTQTVVQADKAQKKATQEEETQRQHAIQHCSSAGAKRRGTIPPSAQCNATAATQQQH